jgi:AcrR family transcriptional regulator
MSSGKAANTRIAILDAARTLYELHGYFSVGLETVAKKAGVSRQAVYLHFESKADLLRALHQRVYEQDVEPVMHKVWDRGTAVEGLNAFVDASAKALPKIIAIAKALDTARPADPDVEATWTEPAAGRYADCRRMAEWLKRDGVLVPEMKVAEAADILWSLMSFGGYDSLVVDRGWAPTRWARWVEQTLRQMLCGQSAGVAKE